MGRWKRVGPLEPVHFTSAAVMAICLATLALVVWGLIFSPNRDAVPGMIFGGVLLAVFAGAMFRFNRLGVFISDRGVRVRTLTSTAEVAWPHITGFEDRPMTEGFGSWAAKDLEVRAVWIMVEGGEPVQTTISYRSDKTTNFLPSTNDFVSRWNRAQVDHPVFGAAQRAVERSGLIASEKRCRKLLAQLRAELREHR